MKLIYSPELLEVEITSDRPTVLSIENPEIYLRIMVDLWNQYNGQEGGFHLLDHETERKISKEICFILNPILVDCNERKILTKVYDQLKEDAITYLADELAEMNRITAGFLDKLVMAEPYHLDFEPMADVTGICKLYNIRLDYPENSLVDKIVDYIRLYHQVFRCNYYVISGLKSFLNSDDLQMFYQACQSEQIGLLLLENHLQHQVPEENNIIIDFDKCLISL